MAVVKAYLRNVNLKRQTLAHRSTLSQVGAASLVSYLRGLAEVGLQQDVQERAHSQVGFLTGAFGLAAHQTRTAQGKAPNKSECVRHGKYYMLQQEIRSALKLFICLMASKHTCPPFPRQAGNRRAGSNSGTCYCKHCIVHIIATCATT